MILAELIASKILRESEKMITLADPASRASTRVCKMAYASAVNTEAPGVSLYLKQPPNSEEKVSVPAQPSSTILDPSV